MNTTDESNEENTAETEVVPTGEVTKDEKTMGMLCYLLVFSGLVIPFGSIIGPLILWLIKKDDMPFVDKCGKEILNFQITVAIAVTVCSFLFFLVIPIFLIPIIVIANAVFTIMGALKANEGQDYQYPFAIKLIK